MPLVGKNTSITCLYPVISPENIYTSNITWGKQFILGNIYIYTITYVHAIIKNKEVINLKTRGMFKDLKGGKEKEKCS